MLKNIEKWHTKVPKKQHLCCFFIDLNVKIWYFNNIQKKKIPIKGDVAYVR